MDINDSMMNSVFFYKCVLNENKNIIIIDESRLQYNELYKSYDFYDAKFPEGYENIPGFNQIIEKIVEQSKDNSPLIEYESKQLNRDA
jgi:hypothetical protein